VRDPRARRLTRADEGAAGGARGRSLHAASALLALTLALACQRPEAAAGGRGTDADTDPGSASATVVDDAGRSHAAPLAAERIVSLVPSVTELLLELGLGERLVGRTDFDTAPQVRELPSVGGGLQPTLEALIALRPDLVIRFEGPSDPTTPRRLDEAGVAHFAVRPERVADVRSIALRLGRLLGREARAEALVADLDARLDSLARAARDKPGVRVAFLLGGPTAWVAGPGTYIDELITLAGGVNVFADLDRTYAEVPLEQLVVRTPDAVLVPRGAAVPARLPDSLPVIEVEGDVQLPGPSVADAAAAVSAALDRARTAAGRGARAGGG